MSLLEDRPCIEELCSSCPQLMGEIEELEQEIETLKKSVIKIDPRINILKTTTGVIICAIYLWLAASLPPVANSLILWGIFTLWYSFIDFLIQQWRKRKNVAS